MRRTALIVLLVVGFAMSFAPAARADTVRPNSGLPGSTCAPGRLYAPFTAPGPGVRTTGLGSDAPAYYELGLPTGAYAGKPAKGVMLVIHGGGWFVVGKEAVAAGRPYADGWRARGWATLSIDYRACAQSVNDVFWFMTRLRQLQPRATVCAAGLSAGGHLALLLASFRRDLSCVISVAGPTDFPGLLSEQTYDGATKTMTSDVATKLYYLSVGTFGAPATRMSPITYTPLMGARVLLVNGESDNKVPIQQASDYAAAVRRAHPDLYVDQLLLPTGDQPFVHCGVSAGGLLELTARENALVAPLVG